MNDLHIPSHFIGSIPSLSIVRKMHDAQIIVRKIERFANIYRAQDIVQYS